MIRKFSAALLLLASASATMAQMHWTAFGLTQNWSDASNWDYLSTPGAYDQLYFEDLLFPAAPTNVIGAVNNIVSLNTSVAAVKYMANVISGDPVHYYTTLIPTGVTLTLGGSGGMALIVGDEPDLGYYIADGFHGQNSKSYANYTTITGAGKLLVNDFTSSIYVGLSGSATLDMSGLNTFTANVEKFRLNANLDDPVVGQSPGGTLLLARTNTITTSPNLTAPGILMGCLTNKLNTTELKLGAVNTFNTDGLTVGGPTAKNGTRMYLGTPGATFKLRGSAGGTTSASVFSVGDQSADLAGYSHFYLPFSGGEGGANGVADFSGGSVDIRASDIYIGRAASPNNTFLDNSSASGQMILEQGNVNATNVFVGYKPPGTNASIATGVLTLRSNHVMTVANNLYLGYRTNSGSGSGTLSVTNSTLTVGGSLFAGYGAATISLSGSPMTVAGVVSTSGINLNVSSNSVFSMGGSLTSTGSVISLTSGGRINMTSGGSIAADTLSGGGYATNASGITVSGVLNPGGTLAAGSLFLGTNFVVGSGVSPMFDLNSTTTTGSGVNDYINVSGNVTFNSNPLTLTYQNGLTVGTYTLMNYGGSQSGTVSWANPTRADIGLIQGGGAVQLVVTNLNNMNLVWSAAGGTNANWDTASTNWNSNTERFYQLDNVAFNEPSGVATNVVVVGNVQPSSMVFNHSTANYLISGSGSIIGGGSLTKNGTGTLTMNSANLFTGPVNLNAGVIAILNPSAFGATTSGTVIISNGAALDVSQSAIGQADWNVVGGIGFFGRSYILEGNGFGSGAIYNINGGNYLFGNGQIVNSGVALSGNTTIQIPAASQNRVVGFYGVASSSMPRLNLGGFALTTLTPATTGGTYLGARVSSMLVTNGSINVGSGQLIFNNCLVDGNGGSINLSNSTVLRFEGYTTANTGYVAKAINVVNNAEIWDLPNNPQNNPTAVGYTLPVSSPIAIGTGGSLLITNTQPLLCSGAISGNGALTKDGSARLTLNAASTFSGSFNINDGGLTLGSSAALVNTPLIQFGTGVNNNTLDTTAVTGGYTVTHGTSQTLYAPASVVGSLNIGTNGTLIGNTTIAGAFKTASGSEVAIGGTNILGSITVNSNLTLGGGHFTWEVAPAFETGDHMVVNGNLTLSNLTTFKIGSIGGFSPDGTNTLITYTGTLTGGLANITNINPDVRFVVKFINPVATPGKIQVVLTVPPADLVWKGNSSPNPSWWDVKVTTNWLNGASPDIFWSSDRVLFDDTASSTLVDLRGTQIGPDTIRMNNTSSNYLFIGSASLVAASLTNDGSGGLVISNQANNQLVGNGLILNAGTVTFAQPTNATLTAKLSGYGSLAKSGTNQLTVVSADSTNFGGAVALSAGTLRSGSANAFGAGTVTIASGATLDINGQAGDMGSVAVSGSGLAGKGAIDNRGVQQQKAFVSVALNSDSTFAASSNRWDITTNNFGPGTFTGNNYKLTKTGAKDIWIGVQSDTGLGDIDITNNAGRLVFAGLGTQLGNSASNVVVRTNAQLGFASGIQANAKNVTVQPGGALYAYANSNAFAGPIVMNTAGVATNCVVWTDFNGRLTLSGNLSGAARLNLRSAGIVGTDGTLTLSGTNTYTGGTLVKDGTLVIANNKALPANTNLVLNSRSPYNSLTGHPIAILGTGVTSPTNVLLDMNTMGDSGPARASLAADGGTWAGPIRMTGSNGLCRAMFFSTGTNGGLIVQGAVDGTGFIGGGTVTFDNPADNDCYGCDAVTLQGEGVRFNGPLVFTGTLLQGSWGGDSEFYQMPKLYLGAAGNYWTNTGLSRCLVQIGTNNALPPAPMKIGHSGGDHRVVIDLNGYNQAFVGVTYALQPPDPTFVNDPLWFGNSSTNSNSTLTYSGSGSTICGPFIVDAFDTNAPIQRTTALSVTSGDLRLLTPVVFTNWVYDFYTPQPAPTANTYSGPTTVSGGILHADTSILRSPVTVNGTGTLMGTGPLGGSLLVSPGGTLAPGGRISAQYISGPGWVITTNGIGAMTVNNNVTLAGTCRMEVNLSSNVFDTIVCASNLTYGGTIVISNVGAQALTNGTILPLFSAASYTPGSVVVQPSPGFGLRWDTSYLAVNGTLRVTTVSTTPVPIVSSVSGGGTTLDLSWPLDHTGWRLQTQTNNLSVGLTMASNTWHDVPGSTATNAVSIPISKLNPTVFFRLLHP